MRSRNWCITSWKEPVIKTDLLVYYIYKKEICPETKKEHFHAYIEGKEKINFNMVKEIFDDKTIHIEPRRGTQKQAIDYVCKEETKAGEPVEWGTKKKQGKRSDVDEIYQDVIEGHTLKEILSEHQGNALRMIHAVEKAMLVHHGFCKIDSWIELNRKKVKDRLDEKVIDDLEKKLLN